ncbi:HNH endonuclease [Microbacterium sp. dk485]|uniref:HNH endonuclease signature motif containing protein n=1 Tax=Microbacterium sp. dk485 TaxID=2560021 RepID=UPI001073FBF5|nr:HNH endonuclease signature motif containing protein [Microbacterium sp. dk485]TFV85178.1 HNH endonuclease [Microbacterium sp. dk485]
MEISSWPGETTTADATRMRTGLAGLQDADAAVAKAQAQRIRSLAALAEVATGQVARLSSRDSREREMPMRSVAAEVAFATQVHDMTAQRELGDAHTLVTQFAATVTALEDARISKRHVDVILEAGLPIADDQVRAAWEETVLEYAARQAPGRTKAYARQLAEAVNPEGMTVRHARAAETRGVSIIDLDDGMALLQLRLPAAVAYGIRDRLRRQARAIRDAANTERARRAHEAAAMDGATESGNGAPSPTDGSEQLTGQTLDITVEGTAPGTEDEPVVDDTRTLVQIGADVAADMLLTGAPAIDPTTGEHLPGGLGAIHAQVQVVVPVLTLLGKTDAGASLHGQIPIDPDTARHFAGGATGWDRVLCHPITGTVLEVDRYTPGTDQRRYLQARDQHCRGFGCRQPAHRCQIDHNHEHHDGGPTALSNLAHFCTRHHTLKTETEWTVRQLPDGTVEFTSPLGNTYTDEPPPRVMFIPDGDPPPF